MKILEADETKGAAAFFEAAAKEALKATCRRARCGTVVVAGGKVIGRGHNGPPLGQESNRTCDKVLPGTRKPAYDRTCCIHAEWRAILDACKRHPELLAQSRLYFMRLDDAGNMTKAGEPFCTVCSRLAMEAGIAEFALWQERGMIVWPTDEYDRQSYAFHAV